MAQLPISTHVAVISHSGGKIPDSNPNAVPREAGAENFADVLAAQISAQDVSSAGATSAPPALSVEAPVIEVNLALTDKAAEQATQQLAEVLSGLPLPHLPLSNSLGKLETVEKERSDTRLPLDASTIAGLSSRSIATNPQTLTAEIKPDAGLKIAANTEDEPAIIAASDKALPSKQANFEGGDARTVTLTPTQMPTATRTESASVVTHVAPPLPLAVDIKVGTPGWDTAFSQRVAWAATNQHQVVELRLNPPNLGPIEIRITVSNDQATAVFVSAHASVRESIEAALPKLREMMGESGLTLGNVNVSSQSFQQHQQAGQGQEKSSAKQDGVMSELALDSALPGLSSLAVVRNGLVDIFA